MGKPKSKKACIKAAEDLWKPVDLDPNLVASDFEGLLAFEEITDYEISKPKEGTYERESNLKKGPKKKRKLKRLERSTVKKLARKDEKASKVDIAENFKPNKVSGKTDEKPSQGMEAWAGMGISEPLIKALKRRSFTTPTQVQALSIPPAILGRRDILGAAETGSGKTLAFALPILQGILIQKEIAAKNNTDEEEEEETGDPESGNDKDENLSSEDGIDNSDCEGKDDVDVDSEGQNEDDDGDYELVEDDLDGELSDGSNNSDEESADLGCVRVVDNAVFDFKNNSANRQKPLYALILTPTRELAVQIMKHITDAAALTDIKVALVVGGLSSQKQERLLSYGPEIVVGTPGRLWELIQQKHPHFAHIENIRFLAIDETDRMLEKGHFEELTQLLTLLNDNKPVNIRRQNFLFSATLSLVHAPPSYIKRLKKKKSAQLTPEAKLQNIVKQMGLQNPKIVDITQPNCVPKTLKEARIICTTEDKDFYLYYFLKLHPGRTLVFCNSIGCVQRLHSLFTLLQCSPHPLHSNLQQRQRLKNLERFTQNPRGILVATDVAARGLDVPNVQHVIHYQVPRTAESYVHRSGRTARASEDGLTVLLMDGSEVRTYTKIFNTLKRDPILPDFPIEIKYLNKVKERVKLARELDGLELQAKRLSSEESWVKKAVTDMDLELSDDEMPIRSSKGEVDGVKKRAVGIRKKLNVLIKEPLFNPMEHLSKKAFITSGIKSDGTYVAAQGPKPSAVKALEEAVEERKEQRKKRKLERAKMKSVETSNKAGAVQDRKNKDVREEMIVDDEGDDAEGIVEYPDFTKKKKTKNKNCE